MSDRSDVGAVLLAAGESRRMGERNKLLLTIDGEAMVRRAARTLLASRVALIVAVLGHQAAEVGEALDGLPVKRVHNPAYRDGQMTSVRCGLDALPETLAGVLICLADQPSLTPADIDFMIDAFDASDRLRIAVPMRDGLRGNPIVLPSRFRAELSGQDLNFGCRNLIARNPDLVFPVAVSSRRYFTDIDTPADLSELEQG